MLAKDPVMISFHIKKPCNTAQPADASETEETDVEDLLESLEKKVDLSSGLPKCIASKVCYYFIGAHSAGVWIPGLYFHKNRT